MEIRKKRTIEWGKNVLILLLMLSAVYLISQSTLYDGFGTLSNDKKGNTVQFSQTELNNNMNISIQPIRLAVQNSEGRYGVQYDRQTVDHLFEKQLGSLLREALIGAENNVLTTESKWNEVLSGNNIWIYYDFFSHLPLSGMTKWLGSEEENPILSGTARRFLLTESKGKNMLYYFNEEDRQYYYCILSEGGRLSTVANEFVPNGAVFSFEEPDTYGALKHNVMILPTVPNVNVYEVKNPLEQAEKGEQEKLLQVLSFNPRTVKDYQSADGGMVIREGLDTLRILNKGTIVYQSQDTGQGRYPISNYDPGSLVEVTQELLTAVVADRCGEARPYLKDFITQQDGNVIITFGYRLNGAPVQIFNQGDAAEFYIKNGNITDFVIHLRQYSITDEKAIFLPEQQAAAAIKAMGQEGKELLLSYNDKGDGSRVTANWIVY